MEEALDGDDRGGMVREQAGDRFGRGARGQQREGPRKAMAVVAILHQVEPEGSMVKAAIAEPVTKG